MGTIDTANEGREKEQSTGGKEGSRHREKGTVIFVPFHLGGRKGQLGLGLDL